MQGGQSSVLVTTDPFPGVMETDIDNVEEHQLYVQCVVCSKIITAKGTMCDHSELPKNSDKKQVSTQKTKSNAKTVNSITIRKKVCREPMTFKCTQCPKAFKWKSQLKDHMCLHLGTFKVTCLFCDKGIRQVFGLEIHMRTHTGEKPLECSVCGRGFADPTALKRHVQCHYGHLPSRYECYFCGKKFDHNGHFEVHLRSHTGERPFKCEICPDKAIMQKRDLQEHMKSHTGERPHQCKHCNKSFSKKNNLNSHIFHVHTHQTEMSIKCNICGMSFKYVGTMTRHMRKEHEGVKPFKCSHCRKAFYDQGDLRKHVNWVHLKVQKHSCVFCDRPFSISGNLHNHIRRHIDEKPFECQKCEKGFPDMADWNKHGKICNTSAGWTCLFCGKVLRDKKGCDGHIRNHVNEKPEFCNVCNEEFVSVISVDRHMVAKHGKEKKCACPICGRKFYNMTLVKQHANKLHVDLE